MSNVDDIPPDAPKPVSPPRGVPEPRENSLGFVRPLATFAVIAMVLGRAIGPSMRGLAVGLGRSGEILEFAGAIASQLFLILAAVGTLGLGVVSLRSLLPTYVRLSLVSLGGLVIIVTLSASASRLPPMSLVLIGAASGLLSIVAAVDTMRTPFARAASTVFALAGGGALLRVASVALAMREGPTDKLAALAHGASTMGFVLEAIAIAVAVGIVASQTRKLTSPATFLALGLAMVATRYALAGASDESGVFSVLLFRASRALALRPEPFVSPTLVTFISFAGPAIACAALATRSLTPAIHAAVALALLARGGADVPLCALALVLGSVTLVLAARDHRGLWSAIAQNTETPASPSAARGSDS